MDISTSSGTDGGGTLLMATSERALLLAGIVVLVDHELLAAEIGHEHGVDAVGDADLDLALLGLLGADRLVGEHVEARPVRPERGQRLLRDLLAVLVDRGRGL